MGLGFDIRIIYITPRSYATDHHDGNEDVPRQNCWFCQNSTRHASREGMNTIFAFIRTRFLINSNLKGKSRSIGTCLLFKHFFDVSRSSSSRFTVRPTCHSNLARKSVRLKGAIVFNAQ